MELHDSAQQLTPVVNVINLRCLIVKDVRGEIRSRRATYGPVKLTLTEDGISASDADGSAYTEVWRQFAGFHVGRYVIVCPKVGSPVYLRISTEGLSDSLRQEIRSALSSHLVELGREDLRSHVNS